MKRLLILANVRINANHVHLFSCSYQFPLGCDNGIAQPLVLAASGDVRGRLADEGILRPAPVKKGHTQAYSVVV